MSRPFSDPNLPEGGIRGEGEIHGDQIRNPEVSYDRTDMSAKAVAGFLIALAIAGVFMHLTVWSIYKYLAGPTLAPHPTARYIQSSTRELPQGDPVRTFPPPRLQPDPVADLNKFRISEEEMLKTYGWVNQQAGVARIPIEQAIDDLAKQGLPTRQQPPDKAATESAEAPVWGSGGAETMQESGETSGGIPGAAAASKQ